MSTKRASELLAEFRKGQREVELQVGSRGGYGPALNELASIAVKNYREVIERLATAEQLLHDIESCAGDGDLSGVQLVLQRSRNRAELDQLKSHADDDDM